MSRVTKAELIEKLKGANVELTGDEKLADLNALAEQHGLIEAKDEAVEEEKQEETSEAAPAEEAPADRPAGVRILLKQRDPSSRVFSLADHGENWQEIADEFRKNHPDNIRGEESL